MSKLKIIFNLVRKIGQVRKDIEEIGNLILILIKIIKTLHDVSGREFTNVRQVADSLTEKMADIAGHFGNVELEKRCRKLIQ